MLAHLTIRVSRAASATAVALLTLVLTACGASSSRTSAPTTGATPATPTTTAATPAPTSHGVTVLPAPVVSAQAGAMRAALHGESRDPTAGRLWHYSVLAIDSSGGPLRGTVDTEFALGGQVVGRESPPTHPLKNGRLDDGVTFPSRSIGIPLTFQVVVHTRLGSVTLEWPVRVKR